MTRPLVYVAGPITGDPWGCVRKAVEVADDARIVQVAAVKQDSTTDAGLTVYVKQIEEEP